MDNLEEYLIKKGQRAKNAARVLSTLDTNCKNKVLLTMAKSLEDNIESIIKANSIDIKHGEEKGLSKAMLDRLLINEKRILDMSEGLKQVAELPDPIGEIVKMRKRPNGITIGEKRVPLGVIGIIYEARPNVTVDAAALCLKSGNAVLLRGGSEAINTNKVIADILSNACKQCNLPEGAIQLIETTDREAVNIMLKLNEYIDVLIPRGGKGLIQTVVKNATVPVIETGVGNCHIFIDESADLTVGESIVINGKVQRPAVCNATESLLIHENIANDFLPMVAKSLTDLGVELRVCNKSKSILEQKIDDKNILNKIVDAVEEDWDTEYLDLILAVKVVSSIDEALDHIYKHSTKHSEAIITENYSNSQRFLNEVDAAAVYVNASTRFTDGFEYGFGAEIGISTQKLHARGPMGLEQLTTTKYIVYGNGQIRK
ncbi:glutamate-5-semialdehyde dehydrogenase [Clostridium tetanomorphum]|uniref:Gamma-glutamyl phosphate reductase n=1 Tax=Clostridium tetanomorphum TaxID=1553 RepID=A0A923E4U5_CLOTT|nr:glutamate-5-semialdehyde dehydrogenase [Clostridium tetanomorphum]KAJ52798.1 gamma-glutamyl phosphate reductase [Clostridium tetanomorphum DSM 665]MBC2396450.1 glutamate-5-semialdehyde dehydrogenase [Clostridium tetanomorphum]MBP1865383.1 glutamate-5-semialdehyde dehydrogenase [Clostridium tetanomorphum]NRS84850.1 glutamate-5-semialdehyde dehydrogenase [Clostridium tetanomorphum]NRZ98068.1 glutamate-5-semialdehyde dehydrogenase [Clostridium tetanomorphum]